MKSLGIILFMVTANVAFGAPTAGGEHHAMEIPTREIFWQIFNLSILFSALIYFLRQPVKNYFASRKTEFLNSAQKSQAARQTAEQQYLEIQRKLKHMEDTREESLARAQAEASDLRRQMIRDAEELAARVRKEAEATMKMEIARARHDLQSQFVQDAIAGARTVLTKDISNPDQQKLQADFLKNIQAVNP